MVPRLRLLHSLNTSRQETPWWLVGHTVSVNHPCIRLTPGTLPVYRLLCACALQALLALKFSFDHLSPCAPDVPFFLDRRSTRNNVSNLGTVAKYEIPLPWHAKRMLDLPADLLSQFPRLMFPL